MARFIKSGERGHCGREVKGESVWVVLCLRKREGRIFLELG